jgi:hypothetical protein
MGVHPCAPVDGGWYWTQATQESECEGGGDFPARLVAEGLTEAECHHLSGMNAATAIEWCKHRASGVPRGLDPVDEMGDHVRYIVGPDRETP